MKLTSLIAFLFFASLVTAQSNKQIKKNSIKSVTEMKYDYSTGVEEKEIESQQFFSDKGEIIELKEYSEGKLKTHEKYAYDSYGNKIKQIDYDDKGRIDKIVEFKYSGKLKTERITFYSNGKVKNKKVYTYEYYEEN